MYVQFESSVIFILPSPAKVKLARQSKFIQGILLITENQAFAQHMLHLLKYCGRRSSERWKSDLHMCQKLYNFVNLILKPDVEDLKVCKFRVYFLGLDN